MPEKNVVVLLRQGHSNLHRSNLVPNLWALELESRHSAKTKLQCWVRALILWKDKAPVLSCSSRIRFYNVGLPGCSLRIAPINRSLVMCLDPLVVNNWYHNCLLTTSVFCSTKPSKRPCNCLCPQHVSLITSWCRFVSAAHRARDPGVCA